MPHAMNAASLMRHINYYTDHLGTAEEGDTGSFYVQGLGLALFNKVVTTTYPH